MSANHLYHTWFRRIEQLWPELRVTQLRNFAWLLVGICLSHSVHLHDIAGQIPGRAKLLSLTRRLSRFLSNQHIRVRQLYGPIVRDLLRGAGSNGGIRLIVDATKVGFGHQLLIIAIAYRKRALPVAWTWVKGRIGHSTSVKQLALLAHVHRLIPKGVLVLVVGDCEFGAVDVLRQLDRWCWQYVLRQPCNNLIDLTLHNQWHRFSDVLDKPGQSKWLGKGFLNYEHVYPVHLLAHWEKGEDTPWLLATNLATKQAALYAYRRRPWIEVVCTQMTKTSLLTRFAGWNDIVDLNLVIVNDDTIDEKFYQLPPLLKGSLVQSLLNALTECLDRGGYGSHFESFLSLGLHLVQLGLQRLLFLDDFPALTLKLG
jgi:hypothetical protein